MVSLEVAKHLGWMHELECTHSVHADVADGVDASHRSKSALAAQWPPLMSALAATALVATCDVAPVALRSQAAEFIDTVRLAVQATVNAPSTHAPPPFVVRALAKFFTCGVAVKQKHCVVLSD